MWKTPTKTAASTLAITTPRVESFVEEGFELFEVPAPLRDHQKYNKLYRCIHSAHARAFKSIDQDEKDNHVRKVRETINNQLARKEKHQQFLKKFGVSSHRNYLAAKAKGFQEKIGVTALVENERQLNEFLADHRQAVELNELTRLTEYYLNDIEREKSNIDYIDKIELNGRHLRLAPKQASRPDIFMGTFGEYQKLRKIASASTDRQLQQSCRTAKNNPTYRRVKNFAQTQYVIQKDIQNLIVASDVHSSAEEQQRRNLLTRVFLHFATYSEALRVYYDYIEGKRLTKLYEAIAPATQEEQTSRRVTPALLKAMGDKIMKYKSTKVLHFEDFRELVETLSGKCQCDAIQNILASHPAILEDRLDQFQQENTKDIQALLQHHKVRIALKRLYEKYEEEIVARQYLPLPVLIEIMKKSRVVPKIITMGKFVHVCLWNKMRIEGFDLEEFMRIQVSLGLSLKCSLQGIEEYLHLLRLDELILMDP